MLDEIDHTRASTAVDHKEVTIARDEGAHAGRVGGRCLGEGRVVEATRRRDAQSKGSEIRRLKWPTQGDQLENDDAERPKVSRRAVSFTTHLFRAEVIWRPTDG